MSAVGARVLIDDYEPAKNFRRLYVLCRDGTMMRFDVTNWNQVAHGVRSVKGDGK